MTPAIYKGFNVPQKQAIISIYGLYMSRFKQLLSFTNILKESEKKIPIFLFRYSSQRRKPLQVLSRMLSQDA